MPIERLYAISQDDVFADLIQFVYRFEPGGGGESHSNHTSAARHNAARPASFTSRTMARRVPMGMLSLPCAGNTTMRPVVRLRHFVCEPCRETHSASGWCAR